MRSRSWKKRRGPQVLDDRKHSEVVAIKLTEREFVDLCRMAGAEDRKPAEMARFVLRRFMYGMVGDKAQVVNENGGQHE